MCFTKKSHIVRRHDPKAPATTACHSQGDAVGKAGMQLHGCAGGRTPFGQARKVTQRASSASQGRSGAKYDIGGNKLAATMRPSNLGARSAHRPARNRARHPNYDTHKRTRNNESTTALLQCRLLLQQRSSATSCSLDTERVGRNRNVARIDEPRSECLHRTAATVPRARFPLADRISVTTTTIM